MMPLDFARVLAGPGASLEEIARHLYAMRKMEHEFFYGPGKPFPGFWEWLEQETTDEE